MMNPIEIAAPVALVILSVSVAITFIRLVIGPSLPDRVVALDLAGLSIAALVAAYSIESQEPLLLRAATVLALISFLATVSFAYYIQRKGIE